MYSRKFFDSKEVHTTSESILKKLKSDLSLQERKSFLEELLQSRETTKLLTEAAPLWKNQLINLQIEIEREKEFIRMYGLWTKNRIAAKKEVDQSLFCTELDRFLIIAEETPTSEEYKKLYQVLFAIVGEECIEEFSKRCAGLFQLNAQLADESEKAEFTLAMTEELLPMLKEKAALEEESLVENARLG